MKLVNENELEKLHSKLEKIPLKLTLCGLFVVCPVFMMSLPRISIQYFIMMFMVTSDFYSLFSLIFWGIGITENSLIGIVLGCTLFAAGFTFAIKTCAINAILNFLGSLISMGFLFGGIAVDAFIGARYFLLKKKTG